MIKSATISQSAKRGDLSFGSLLLCCALLGACNLKSDTSLTRVFQAHSEGFEQLIAMSEWDRGISRIQVSDAPPDGSPISRNRWQAYQSLFHDLGLKAGLERREDFPSAIFLLEECSGTAITHDCKGYVYSKAPLTPLQENLNGPPAQVAFKFLVRNWYLYRDDG
jgi:hypothetical protein